MVECDELVLYGASNTLKLSTNESRASLELDQCEWRTLPDGAQSELIAGPVALPLQLALVKCWERTESDLREMFWSEHCSRLRGECGHREKDQDFVQKEVGCDHSKHQLDEFQVFENIAIF